MELPLNLYNWLVDISVLTEYELREKTEDKVILDQDATQLFEIGLKMPLLLLRLLKLKEPSNYQTLVGALELDKLKNSVTPAAKLYNWNLIVRALEACNIHVEDSVKNLIVGGDTQVLADLLTQVMEVECSPEQENNEDEKRNEETKEKPAEVELDKGVVDLDELDINKKPEKIRNCLEFLLITISRGFKLKPKQAAGLMTDGNKYLSHILVKGLKNDATPVVAWLSQMYTWSDTFANLIKSEEKDSSVSMVLNCLKGGLYSKHKEIAVWTARIFTRLANSFLQMRILKQAWEWYISTNAGLDGTLYFINKHIGMEHLAFDLMISMGRQNINLLFMEHYKILINDPVQYWNNNLMFMKYLYSFSNKCNEQEKTELDEVIKFWLNSICSFTENTKSPLHETTIISNILVSLWLFFPQVFEENVKVPEYTLSLLTRCARDKSLSTSIFSSSNLFKLLETLALRKNSYALLIYKALTFSLVENYTRIEVREYAMENFRNLFRLQPTIPVGILIDPIIKQIQLLEASDFTYEVFDFKFFATVVTNPRLSIKNGIQLLDLLARILLNDPLFAPLASDLFIEIVNKWTGDESIENLLEKFVKITLSTLMGSFKKNYKAQRYSSQKMAKQCKSFDNPIEDMQNTCIIKTLKQVQTVASENVKNLINDNTLTVYSSIKKQFNIEWIQLKTLMLGNPEKTIAIYEKKNSNRKENKSEDKVDKRTERKNERRIIPQRSGNSIRSIEKRTPELQQRRGRSVNRGLYSYNTKGRASIPEKVNSDLNLMNENNKQLVIYTQNKSDMEISKKAMQEIERIRKTKLEREAQKHIIEAEKNEKIEREKKILRQQLEWRKIELGVGKDVNVPIILEEGVMDKRTKKILPEIQLIDFSCEEEREKEAIFLYMKKYRKLFRYLFTKYANSCYSTKTGAFDTLKDKSEIITLGEITKLFKDHNVTSSMLNREELATFVRLVNAHLGKIEISNLTFEGFQEYFVQVAIYIYSKSPFTLSHLPLVESVKELVSHFERATEVKGENTLLYKTPDVTTLGDKELLKELNKVVKTNPDYPLPEGYRRVNEKEANFEFRIKPCLENSVSETKRIAVEILDEIIFKNIPGIHIIEPIVKYEVKTKVYPDIVRPQKQLLQPRYLEAVEKKVRPKDLESIKTSEPHLKKRILDDSLRKLPANMKLLVARFPKESREIAKEVARLLDEIIDAAVEGRNSLLEKKKEKFNKATKLRDVVYEEAKKADIEKEQKRRNRHYFLKQKIEEARKKEAEENERKKKEEEESKLREKERLDKERLERQKERERTKKKIQEMREKKEEEKKKAQEEELKKQKVEEEKRIKAREEFLRRKKEEIDKKLKETEEKRKKEKEEETKQQMLKEKKLLKEKLKLDKQTKEEREAREILQKQKIEFEKFMRSEEVIALLDSRYYAQLEEIFNFYSKLEDPEINQEVLKANNVIQYKSLVKFARHFNIIPELIELQDIIFIFNNVVKNKRTYGKDNVKGFTKEDFLESIVKICILGKYNLGVPIEEVSVNKEKEGYGVKGFDMRGVDVTLVENFLKMLGLTTGEKKGHLVQALKKIKQENNKEITYEKVKTDYSEEDGKIVTRNKVSKQRSSEKKGSEQKVSETNNEIEDKEAEYEETKEMKTNEQIDKDLPNDSPQDKEIYYMKEEGKGKEQEGEDAKEGNESIGAEAIDKIMNSGEKSEKKDHPEDYLEE